MPSMTRALFWKEWREQRPIVIAGVALALVLPLFLVAGASVLRRQMDLETLSSAMPVLCAALIWPLMAVACGASTIAGEIGDGTLVFLLSRPASRLRVWLVKVATAGLALLTIVAGSLVVALGFLAVARRGDVWSVLQVEVGQSLELGLLDFGTFAAIGGLFLLFACSVFFSTFLSRAMTAAGAGLVTALVIGALLFLVWTRLDLVPLFEPQLLALELAAAGALALLASLRVFTGGEILTGRKILRDAVFGGAAALVLLVVISVPVVLASTRLDLDSAQLSDVQLVPGRQAVVATAHGEHGSSSEVWLVHLDGSGFERLTGRLCGKPGVSPDGRHVAYVSARGGLGLRSSAASLRVMDTQGGGDRLLVPDLPGEPYLLGYSMGDIRFAPGGDRLALVYQSSLVVVGLDGSRASVRSVEGDDEIPRYARIVGWSPNGEEVLLLSPLWSRDRATRLVGYDPDTRRVREIYRSMRPQVGSPMSDLRRSGVVLLALGASADSPAEEGEKVRLVAVDVATGAEETIVEADCLAGFDLSADEKTLVYGACTAERGRDVVVELRFRDRSSGAEIARVPVNGRPWSVHLSPAAEWIAIRRFAPAVGALPTLALRADGVETAFDGRWVPLGWTGRDRVVLAEPAESGFRALAVGLATTGEVRTVFP